jgi:hypothetical protein
VVLRTLPAAPLAVRRTYLIVVARPLPAAPLALRRTYSTVVFIDSARAGARTVACGHATLPHREINKRQMRWQLFVTGT